jgi:segregation and condensation protein A
MLLPELVWTATPEQLARLAAHALQPKPRDAGVSLVHLHNPVVSVREQAALISSRLQRVGATSFRALIADAGAVNVVVARFLALLELFRESLVAFDQMRSLGELTIRWTGPDGDVDVSAAIDEFDGNPNFDSPTDETHAGDMPNEDRE